jgi:calcineurin-like phosphoesterase family protein
MSAAVWFTSDTHFCHAMVANLRGFETAGGHDEALIQRWNEAVRPGDVVWHLGDVGMSRGFLPLVDRLNGTKHLITGNHDAVWPGHRDSHKHQREWLQYFASVQAFARRRIAGQQVLMSHFPYRGDHTETERHEQYRLRDEGLWLIHGHTHSTERTTLPTWLHIAVGPGDIGEALPRGRQVHVGVDAWDLRPVPLDAVEKIIARATEPALAP